MKTDSGIPERKAGTKKTALFFALIFLGLFVVTALLWALWQPTGEDVVPMIPSTSTQSPDPVKADIPPNGGTIPSPTGTGPGSNRSLLGPSEP